MSLCRCCLTPHPFDLLQRFQSSIKAVKRLRKISTILETQLIDEHERLQRISSRMMKFFIYDPPIGNLSQVSLAKTNLRLTTLNNSIYKIQHLTIRCSLWLKKFTAKDSIRSELKRFVKECQTYFVYAEEQLDLKRPVDSLSMTKKFSKRFSTFEKRIELRFSKQRHQMDLIEREYLTLVNDVFQFFTSILSSDNTVQVPFIDIEQHIEQWTNKHRTRIPWLPDEHSSNNEFVDIQIVESKSHDQLPSRRNIFTQETILNWSLNPNERKTDSIMVPSIEKVSVIKSITSSCQTVQEHAAELSSTAPSMPLPSSNRVRLAVAAIEQTCLH